MSKNILTDLSFTQDCINPFDAENSNIWVKLEHLGRYLFASDFLKRYQPRKVADIACGMGYGITELAQITNNIIAVDQSPTILKKAQETLEKNTSKKYRNVHFYEQDLESLPWPKAISHPPLDAIVSFETLEHLLEPELVLKRFSQTLSDRGFLICSVPNTLYDPADSVGLPVNPYHKHFFSFSAFRKLLERHGFQVLYRVGQASANVLFKRESQLLKHKTLTQRLGDFSDIHTPDLVRHLTYLLAYPTAEDVDGSYSLIVVAQKI